MEDKVTYIAELAAGSLEILGIFIIIMFAAVSSILALLRMFGKYERDWVFEQYRHQLARGILLGLELLVAADIIFTVAIELTFTSVGVLAIIVMIRTFLSFTLELEMTGTWPWHKEKKEDKQAK